MRYDTIREHYLTTQVRSYGNDGGHSAGSGSRPHIMMLGSPSYVLRTHMEDVI